MNRAATAYDPFDRDEELAAERLEAAREEQVLWSLEQSKRGNAAGQRDNVGVWIKRRPELPDEARS